MPDLIDHLAALNSRIASTRGDEFLIGEGEPAIADAIAEIARLRAERDMLRSMIETLTHMPPETLRGLNMLAAERDAARAQAAALAEALIEAEETFRLVERPAFEDRRHGLRVRALGEQIGFGALMASASASWRKALEEKGIKPGGEFVAGPCHATVIGTLNKIRTALAAYDAQKETGE
jgi:hypothetical protein